MTVEVEATETTLPALLERIERGDTLRLQKNGRTIAVVSPTFPDNKMPKRTPEQVAKALAGLASADERSKRLGLKFDLEEFKADREFGRR
jgi:antitoxin (DNA-binding transcriptional repressor) of toxin-antitoxin stability system